MVHFRPLYRQLCFVAIAWLAFTSFAYSDLASWQSTVTAGTPAATRFTTVSGASPVSMSVGSFSPGTARSFEFIFNAAGAGPSKTLLGSADPASGGQFLKLHQWNNTGKFGVSTSGVADDVFANSPTISNQQVHAVFTSNGSVTSLYLNGVLQTATIARALAITGTNGLGAFDNAAHTTFSDNLDGSITGFASYARALSQVEVTARYNALVAPPALPTPNLAVWQSVVDAGTAAATRYTSVAGASPVSMSVGTFAAGTPRSFEFVFNAAGAGPTKTLLGSADPASGGQFLKLHQWNNTGKFGVSTSGVADDVFANSPTLSNQHVHAVFTSNGSVTSLYLNGVLQTGTISRALAITGTNGLGAFDNATHTTFSDNLDGSITGFASYARALSQAEVTARFNALTTTNTAPGAPVIGTATILGSSATVAFTPPASDGGSAITGYTATSSPGGLTGTGTSSPITVPGLVAGTSYTFTVTATNAIGTGLASAASNAVVNNNLPPTNVLLSNNAIQEGNSAHATIGTLTAVDPSVTDTHIFTLVSGAGSTDNSSFSISGNTLRITPVTSAASKSSYALRIRATDQVGGFVEKRFTVRITAAVDIPEQFAGWRQRVQSTGPTVTHFTNVTGQNPVTVDVGNFADGSARSFEFVFAAGGSGASRSLLTPSVSTAQVQSLRFNQFNNTQKFGVTTSGVADDVFADSPTRANQLVHAVFVSNGSVTSLYLNGVLQTATIARGLTIKGSNVLGFDLDGTIYGFASYNKALTQSEISSLAQGIVGLGESIPVQDFNLTAWQTVVAQSNAASSRFTPVSGSNPQTIDVGTFAVNSPRSFEFVAEYANTSTGIGVLLGRGQFGDETHQRLSVLFEADGQRMMLSRVTGTQANTGNAFSTQSSNQVKSLNQKVHLVFVSGGMWTTDWYLNGIKQQTIQLPLAFTGEYGLAASIFAGIPPFPDRLPGTIYGFASYGRALTQAEVNQRFQALAAPAPAPTIFTAWENLVSSDQPAALRLEPVLGSSPVSISVGTFAVGSPRSFEFIFNAAGAGPSKTLLGSLNAASGGQSLKLNQWNNTGNFGLTTSGVADEVFSNSPTLSNQSVHAVFVSNGSVTSLYLNGVLQTGSISRAMRITGTNALGAAGNAAHTGFFDNLDGTIQRFASYGRALTQAEVTQRHQALNSPVNLGQNTVSNITAWRKQVSAARPAARYFPTVSGASPIRLDVGNFPVGSPRSFEFICLATGAGPSKALLGSLDSHSGGQILQLNQHNDTQKFGVSTPGVADEVFSSSVTTGNRKVHVVYSSDGTVTRLYVNGMLQMRPIQRGLAITGINALGAYDNAAHDAFLGNLDGTIEGFASYGRELSAAEITARFQTLQDNITAPGTPLIGSALAQDAAAIVSFGASVNNGGAEVTSYTVTSSPGGITATGTGSPITVAGLTNGVSYTFTVTATNSIGTGSASAASNAVVPSGEINTAPTDINLLSNTIADGNTANATVGSLSATDTNLDDSHTFSLVSGTGSADNASFTISGNTLRITPVTNAAVKSSYALRVRATDASGLFFEKALTVRVVAAGANVAKFATSQLHIQPSFNYKQSVTGNFDNDGIPDIAAITTNDQCIVLLSSQGFATANIYNSSRASTAIALADVNRDNVLDLVLGWGAYTSPLTAGVVAYFGSEGAMFDSSPVELISMWNPTVPDFPAFITVMGVDGNSWPRIMVQSPSHFGIRFFQKNATPWGYDLLQSTNTTDSSILDPAPDMRGAVAGDFNQDGINEVAIATLQANGSSKVSVYTWPHRTDLFTVPADVKSMAVGDLNGDGKLDLLMAAGNGANGQLILARNSSANVGTSLTFDTPITLTTGSAGLLNVRCADINRDGRQDVITSENQQLRVFYGSGNMALTASLNNPISVPTSNSGAGGISMNFAAGDFSGDGMIDLFAGNGQLLTNLRGALFAPKPLNLFAGLGQTARPAVPLWIGSSPTPVALTAASQTPWLSVTPTNGFSGISSVMASVDSASRPLGRHRGKVNLSSGNLQGTEANVILDVTGVAGALGASQIVPLPDESIRRSSVASGDFNNDGRLDFVNARTDSSTSNFGLRVMLTGSNGALSPVISSYTPATGDVTDPTPGDYNGDGHLDVVVIDPFRRALAFFAGNGTGVLGMPVYTGFPISSNSGVPILQNADFNGDGIDDVLMVGTHLVSIQLGTSAGIFTAAGHLGIGFNGSPNRFTVGDFNGDGSSDIFINNKIYLGDGLGGIGKRLAGTNLTRPNGQFYKVRADDFNGDNISDVLYWHDNDLRVSLGSATPDLLPDGQQSHLSTPTVIYNATAAGYIITFATTGDINGDGIVDLVAMSGESDMCITLLGNGDGTFQAPKQIPRPSSNGGDAGWPVSVGDVSGDGVPDVFQIRGDQYSSSAWHFYRLPGQAAPTTTTLATTGGGTGLFGGVAPVTVTVAPTTPSSAFSTPLGSVSLRKGSTVVATSTRSTAGTWTFTPVGLGVGSHTLTAQYDGDLRNAPSISGSVTVNIVKAVADIALASSLGVSKIGDTVTFSANISPVTSGSISFSNGTTLLGTGTIDASGLATFTTSSLPTGSNSITASFAGNSDVNAALSSPLTQTVNKLPATVTLKNLLASFDGSAKSAGADTDPSPLPVTITYNGSATPPSAVGSYTVVATVDDPTYQGSATGTFVIQKGTAGISITNVNRIFDGFPKPVAVTTTPAGLPFTLTYNGSSTAPSAIGSYPVVVMIDSPNYQGTANDVLVISAATVTTTTLASSANPSPFLTPPTFTATVSSASGTPSGEMQLLIDNVLFEAKQVNGGVATFSPPASLLAGGARSIRANYNANGAVAEFAPSNATITQVVEKAELAVTLDAATLSQTFNGSARVVTASVTPPATHASVQIDITYNGSSIAPINAGTYNVIATINDPSLEGSVSGTLNVSKAAVALESGPLTVGYTGQAISPTLRLTPDVPFTVTYDATTNGTPAGNPTASPPINAGNYRILVSVGSNYELTPPHLPLFITKRGVGIS
jgi:hypothetical protein